MKSNAPIYLTEKDRRYDEDDRADADASSSVAAATTKTTRLTSLSPFRNIEILELRERHGYGFTLREALRTKVRTPYVCVIQHDCTFMRRTPMEEVVRTMMESKGGGGCDGDGDDDSNAVMGGGGGGCGGGGGGSEGVAKVQYVGISMRSNLTY